MNLQSALLKDTQCSSLDLEKSPVLLACLSDLPSNSLLQELTADTLIPLCNCVELVIDLVIEIYLSASHIIRSKLVFQTFHLPPHFFLVCAMRSVGEINRHRFTVILDNEVELVDVPMDDAKIVEPRKCFPAGRKVIQSCVGPFQFFDDEAYKPLPTFSDMRKERWSNSVASNP
jgi:hypothetical protein